MFCPECFGLRFFPTVSTKVVRQKLFKYRQPLNFFTGECVGKLLQILQIPDHLVDDATYCVIKDWKFIGFRSWKHHKLFRNGVYEGIVTKPSEVSASFMLELEYAAFNTDRPHIEHFNEEPKNLREAKESDVVAEHFIRELKEAAETESQSAQPFSNAIHELKRAVNPYYSCIEDDVEMEIRKTEKVPNDDDDNDSFVCITPAIEETANNLKEFVYNKCLNEDMSEELLKIKTRLVDYSDTDQED